MSAQTHDYQSDFIRRLREAEPRAGAEGQAEGRAAIVLRILAHRGWTCPRGRPHHRLHRSGPTGRMGGWALTANQWRSQLA